MITLTVTQKMALAKILAKLSEKSSVIGYLALALGVFGIQAPSWLPQLGGYVATAAGVVLFLINDRAVGFQTSAPQPAAEVMEPAPAAPVATPTASTQSTATVPVAEPTMAPTASEDLSMSEQLKAYLQLIQAAGSVVLTAEATAPAGSTGADRLAIAKDALIVAYPALGITEAAFDAAWPLVQSFINALVARYKAKAASAIVDAAAAEPAAGAVA